MFSTKKIILDIFFEVINFDAGEQFFNKFSFIKKGPNKNPESNLDFLVVEETFPCHGIGMVPSHLKFLVLALGSDLIGTFFSLYKIYNCCLSTYKTSRNTTSRSWVIPSSWTASATTFATNTRPAPRSLPMKTSFVTRINLTLRQSAKTDVGRNTCTGSIVSRSVEDGLCCFDMMHDAG